MILNHDFAVLVVPVTSCSKFANSAGDAVRPNLSSSWKLLSSSGSANQTSPSSAIIVALLFMALMMLSPVAQGFSVSNYCNKRQEGNLHSILKASVAETP